MRNTVELVAPNHARAKACFMSFFYTFSGFRCHVPMFNMVNLEWNYFSTLQVTFLLQKKENREFMTIIGASILECVVKDGLHT
jgi:hypothetical protein